MDGLDPHNDRAAERLTLHLNDQLCMSPWLRAQRQRGTAPTDANAWRRRRRPTRRLRTEISEGVSGCPPMAEAAIRHEWGGPLGDARRPSVIPLHSSSRRRLQGSSERNGHAEERSARGAACAGQEMENASVIGCGPGAVRSGRGIERDPGSAR